MQDVRPGSRAAHPRDHAFDRGHLGLVRARLDERVIVTTAVVGVSVEHRRVFGVHDEQAVEGRDLLERCLELGGIEVAELVHPAGREERLEAEDARVVQRAQGAEVLGHGTTPEAGVDGDAGDRAFGLECCDGRRRGDAVEGHVDDRRDPACRGGSGRAREALPLGAAGLVDVHMAVHDAGQQHLVGRQIDVRVALQAGADGLDDTAGDTDLGAAHLAVDESGCRAHDQLVVLRHDVPSPVDTIETDLLRDG